jgi:hypothetical protein
MNVLALRGATSAVEIVRRWAAELRDPLHIEATQVVPQRALRAFDAEERKRLLGPVGKEQLLVIANCKGGGEQFSLGLVIDGAQVVRVFDPVPFAEAIDARFGGPDDQR